MTTALTLFAAAFALTMGVAVFVLEPPAIDRMLLLEAAP